MSLLTNECAYIETASASIYKIKSCALLISIITMVEPVYSEMEGELRFVEIYFQSSNS